MTSGNQADNGRRPFDRVSTDTRSEKNDSSLEVPVDPPRDVKAITDNRYSLSTREVLQMLAKDPDLRRIFAGGDPGGGLPVPNRDERSADDKAEIERLNTLLAEKSEEIKDVKERLIAVETGVGKVQSQQEKDDSKESSGGLSSRFESLDVRLREDVAELRKELRTRPNMENLRDVGDRVANIEAMQRAQTRYVIIALLTILSAVAGAIFAGGLFAVEFAQELSEFLKQIASP